MTSRAVGSDNDDADDELTRLEWQASQRRLDADEMARLNTLRQARQELQHDVDTRIEPPDGGNPVMDGDDSP